VAPVTFEAIGKVYPDGTRAVEELDLAIEDGEFMVLVGPSGCGKTTALRMVAGLEDITEGVIRIGSRAVNRVESGERDIAMVFQNYALYPHLTVRANLGFGLKMRKVPRPEIRSKVDQIADVLGLRELLDRKPRQLSGGQRQRVAMGRAIVREPAAFLMDEPLSNLDARLRVDMRAEIASIQRRVGATTIYVTHDQIEAMTMGDRVAVLRKGRLQQVAPPHELFTRPVNLFVASFIGSPQMNLLQADLIRSGDGLALRVGDDVLMLPRTVLESVPGLAARVDTKIALGIRPEYVRAAEPGDTAVLHGKLLLGELLGAETLVHAELPAAPVATEQVREVVRDSDAAALEGLTAAASKHRTTFLARFAGVFSAPPGSPVGIAVDLEHLYLFDLESGDSLLRASSSAPSLSAA
jgi:multiple sugar transport system ATP-binding protein